MTEDRSSLLLCLLITHLTARGPCRSYIFGWRRMRARSQWRSPQKTTALFCCRLWRHSFQGRAGCGTGTRSPSACGESGWWRGSCMHPRATGETWSTSSITPKVSQAPIIATACGLQHSATSLLDSHQSTLSTTL